MLLERLLGLHQPPLHKTRLTTHHRNQLARGGDSCQQALLVAENRMSQKTFTTT